LLTSLEALARMRGNTVCSILIFLASVFQERLVLKGSEGAPGQHTVAVVPKILPLDQS